MIKYLLTTTFFLTSLTILVSQENEHLYFLETDSTWRKELFVFPISFAPAINYQGVEDARFPEGWEDQESPNFWSYAFAWNLEEAGLRTAKDLEADLKTYFNGLMRFDQTRVQLTENDQTGAVFNYSGTVQTLDAFFTKAAMTLNVKVEQIHCQEQKKSTLLFRFSPKDFDTTVWRKLKQAELPASLKACRETMVYKIHELIKTCYEYGQFNGTVLVAQAGKVIYKQGFGQANKEWDIPNKTATKHRLASITKQFTATLILQLAAEGKLKLEAPITEYLSGYPKKTGDQITIHHLLTHSSGIPNYTSFPDYRAQMPKTHSPMDLVQLFADLELEFAPGESFAYSNSGYVLLGVLIEKLTGETYAQALEERIFEPLNMQASGYYTNQELIKNRAVGYDRFANTYQNASYLDISIAFSAGGIYSTVEDLFLWDRTWYTEKLLPKAYKDLMFSPHIPAWGGQHYGYGWEIGAMRIGDTKETIPTIGHGGNINGFNTQITRFPSDQSSIILLNNTGSSPLYDLTKGIVNILYDQPHTLPRRSLAYAMLDTLESTDRSTALAFFEKVRSSDQYRLDQNEMNLSGYKLLETGHKEDAAAIFKLNTELFPFSFNTHDSYGEALLALGDTARAIESYKQSVKLNPGNENGAKILEGFDIDPADLLVKVPVEHLQLIAGTYQAEGRDWKIRIEEAEGNLYGVDGAYRYRLIPVGEDQFINADDGATFVFDGKDDDVLSFVFFGRMKFNKVE